MTWIGKGMEAVIGFMVACLAGLPLEAEEASPAFPGPYEGFAVKYAPYDAKAGCWDISIYWKTDEGWTYQVEMQARETTSREWVPVTEPFEGGGIVEFRCRESVDDRVKYRLNGWIARKEATWGTYHAVGFEPEPGRSGRLIVGIQFQEWNLAGSQTQGEPEGKGIACEVTYSPDLRRWAGVPFGCGQYIILNLPTTIFSLARDDGLDPNVVRFYRLKHYLGTPVGESHFFQQHLTRPDPGHTSRESVEVDWAKLGGEPRVVLFRRP